MVTAVSADTRQKENTPWVELLIVLSILTVLTAIMTWPLVFHLSNSLVGYKDADQVAKVWGFWYSKEALTHGTNPAFFNTLAYPDGYYSPIRQASLTMHILLLPVEVMFSPVAAYNIGFLLTYILTGVAGYYLCKDITGHRAAALFGGVLIMVFPSRVAQAVAGHVETANLALPLLYFLFLRRTILLPSIKNAVWMGVAFSLACMLHLTITVYVMLPLSAFLVPVMLSILRKGDFFNREVWKMLLIGAGIALAIMLPFYIPMLRFSLNPPDYAFEGGANLPALSTDLLGFITPSPDNPVLTALGLVPKQTREVMGFFLPEITAYLGLVPLAFTVLSLVRGREESRGWLLVGLVAMLLSLGPVLKVWGGLIPSPWSPEQPLTLPYALLAKLPVFSLGRTPGRFNLVTGMALAIVASDGVRVFLENARPWKTIVFSLAALIMMVEYLYVFPMEVYPVVEPAAVRRLASMTPDGAVLNVPVGDRYTSHYAIFYQTSHSWPIMDGYSDREIPNRPGVLELLGWLTQPVPDEDIVAHPDPAALRSVLVEQGISYVLLNQRFTSEARAYNQVMQDSLGGPVAGDEELVLYQVEGTSEPDAPVIALTGNGWGEASLENGSASRYLDGSAQLVVYTPHPVQGLLRLQIGQPESECDLRISDQSQTVVYAGPAAPESVIEVRQALEAACNVYDLAVNTTSSQAADACEGITVTSIEVITE
ncbi:MAG: hypothetical protein JXJ17_19215 [Anaerolineae bacterium]|nr:hypothetical protein [Anaerolineae bacterium]